MKIKKLNTIDFAGVVYNIGVKENKNYFANKILVHNCYQDSKPTDGHSKINWYNFAQTLAENKVFEVALGGGEPTMHPEFLNILRWFKEAGVTPNFTTKSLAWLHNPAQWQPIIENIGSFAYSVERADDVRKLVALLTVNDIMNSKVSVQVVMGVVNEWEFEGIATICKENGIRLTLLGYKQAGRGGDFKPNNYNWWLPKIKKLRDQNKIGILCIDTALAEQYEKEILAAGIPSYMFHTKEGKFSMYFDAMTGLVGPSSYCDPKEMIPWNWEYNYNTKQKEQSLEDIFANF